MTARPLLRLLAGSIAVLALVLAVAACGSSDNGSSASGTTATTKVAADVVAKGFSFTVKGPVQPGAQVHFANEDQTDHTMTADGGAFDTGHVAPGKEAALTAPTKSGSYAFHCSIHASMTGTLTVQ